MAETARLEGGPHAGTTVRLQGGPYDGIQVHRSKRWTRLQIEGEKVPEDHIANYVPTRDRYVQRFNGFSRIIARVELPEPERQHA